MPIAEQKKQAANGSGNESGTLDRYSLGERLRQIRKENGWTLVEVAKRSGLATSTVSKVERGLMSLAYDRFMQLADGLEVDVSELFTPEGESFAPESFAITRAGEAGHHETDLYVYDMLGADLSHKQMVPMFGIIRAHDVRDFSEFVKHPGEEFLMVLEGELEVHIEGREPVQLGVHDSIYFDSGMGHLYVSAGKKDTKIIVVCAHSSAARNNVQT
ncbi:MAG: helix-turn-helix transcriptional regulator [Alphaproteobacteria bacterium]|jgi:transcriptional regulator with XRE-family HTH domain|nr:helix-turn-helix transcriptional regulator [Alphaproteobacteria bacterium]MBT4085875.1 helix-turn-helix transcriptional regulator [Alphaproteobacteria bacterium]MBT4542652.1 helix-turn-helix transcriptional regulator [Alphaproteobacteria bacterium]MBT6384862.1 helix-turn-helix transcriptional regulator [Alphaproteobacteria bacterium]MBT7746954.1 helix-turn-helix transcriptional regulator [Alphaproteobacteria bacterium]